MLILLIRDNPNILKKGKKKRMERLNLDERVN